jgi:hypothetical protein
MRNLPAAWRVSCFRAARWPAFNQPVRFGRVFCWAKTLRMSDQLVSLIGVIIGAVSLILTLFQFCRGRRHKRTIRQRSWKFCGIEHTRRDEIDDRWL